MREAQPYLDAPQLGAKAESSVVPDPRKGRGHIRQDIEHCRVLAAYGVICYHNGGFGNQIGYAGLIIFLILSVYLAGDSSPRSPADRARRLLTPWLIWFSFYGIIRVFAGKTLLNTQLSPLASVLFGTASHLWYLPYALMVLIFVDQARRLFSPQSVAYFGASMAMLSLAASAVWREPSILIGYPWAQYAHATPAVFAGLFFMGMNAIPVGVRYAATLGILGAAALAMNVHGLGIPCT